LPARQIEDSVAAAVREMLDDETSVLHAAQDTDADPPRVDRVFQAARTWSRLVQTEVEKTAAIAVLVDRVDLKRDGMRISIKLPLAALEASDAGLPTGVVLTRFFPILMKRRGVELRLVVENRNGPASSVDLTLLKSRLARTSLVRRDQLRKSAIHRQHRRARGYSSKVCEPPDPSGFPGAGYR
jgi:hypothetical protein